MKSLNQLQTVLVCLVKSFSGKVTGYIASATLQNTLGRWSHQQIYRELNKMAAEGLFGCTYQVNDGKPDSKFYTMTDKQFELVDLNPCILDNDVAIFLNVKEAVEYRIETINKELARLEGAVTRSNDAFVFGAQTRFTISMLKAELEVLEKQGMASINNNKCAPWTIADCYLHVSKR